jgi:hypothetical protein
MAQRVVLDRDEWRGSMHTRRIALATVLALSLGTTGSGVATGVGDDELAAAAAVDNEDVLDRLRRSAAGVTRGRR